MGSKIIDPLERAKVLRNRVNKAQDTSAELEKICEEEGIILEEIRDILDPPVVNVILATVGLPRSGKSRWAKRSGYPVVSPDAIRLAIHGTPYNQLAEPWVWTVANTMVESMFEAGHEVVVFDSTMISVARRETFQEAHKKRNIIWVPFKTELKICLERADETMKQVILRMAQSLEWPEEVCCRVGRA